MPQMAPLSWLMLFFFFGVVFMLFNILNYFVFPCSAPTSSLGDGKTTTPMNWKW